MSEVELVSDLDKIVAFKLSILDNEIEKVKFLLSNGVNFNFYKELEISPLHLAVIGNEISSHYEVMKVLLENGADINHRNDEGLQALHLLMQKNVSVETVQMFLDYGADIDGKERNSMTPLYYAVKFGNDLEVVKLLVNNGARLDTKCDGGSTLLHANFNFPSLCLKTMKYLLKNGVDIDAVNDMGQTPLTNMFGPYFAHLQQPDKHGEKIMKFFLKYADVNIIDSKENHILSNTQMHELTWNIILEHLAKLKALNISINLMIIKTINGNYYYKTYFEKCQKELLLAKNTKLKNSWVTFFNLLVDNKRKLKNYAGNEELLMNFNSSQCLKKFPIYGNVIYDMVEKGTSRRELFDKSAVLLCDYLPVFDPGHLIIRSLLDCLSTKDLGKFLQ